MPKPRPPISLELVRQHRNRLDKFEMTARMLGDRYAIQNVREIGRQHTQYPGQRTELDYTKYSIFLYPTKSWEEPLMFNLGIGIDHYSGVIKGYAITSAPSARDTVRLYKSCVLPKHLVLPGHLAHRAQHWDVFGTEDIVAIDNGSDFVANNAMLMFLTLGVIVLRMPPARGDLKGTVERTLFSLETMYIESFAGYVSRMHAGLNPKYTRVRDRARKGASLTVSEFEERFVEAVVEYNHLPHPRFKKPRIQVWRDGQQSAPILLPTGLLQLRSTFALTYEVKLTREGVQVEQLKFNSAELHAVYRSYSGKVHVKLDPDDVRQVLVFVPQYDTPIDAHLTTYELHEKTSLELLKLVLKKLDSQAGRADAWQHPIDLVLDETMKLGSEPHDPTPGSKKSTDAKAAVHAAATPPTLRAPRPRPSMSLNDFLAGTDIDD